MAHIVKVPENTQGIDWIIGDIHGKYNLLKNFLARKVKTHDRLFLVGDLTDRGEESLKVLELIEKHNAKCVAKHRPPQILFIRGNHENMLMEYIITRLAPDDFSGKEIKGAQDRLFENGGKWVEKLDDATLTRIFKLISPQPYIMHVAGDRPFNTVHADMPFSDEELKSRLEDTDEEARELSAEEIQYSIWARAPNADSKKDYIIFEDTDRDSGSILTYCGHEVFGGVRADTNHADIDVGSYFTDHLCVVNHTYGSCEIFDGHDFVDDEDLVKRDHGPRLLDIKEKINNVIDFRIQPKNLLLELIYKYNKKTEMLSPQGMLNRKLNYNRFAFLKEARIAIHAARNPQDIDSTIVNVLVRNMVEVRQSTKFNKKNLGSLHNKLLSEYPHLIKRVANTFNKTLVGQKHPVTEKDILPRPPKQEEKLSPLRSQPT